MTETDATATPIITATDTTATPATATAATATSAPPPPTHPYVATTAGLALTVATATGTDSRLLTNVTVIISVNRIVYGVDGPRRELVLDARLGGRTLTHTIPVTALSSPRDWLLELFGPSAIIYPLAGAQQHIATATQLLSGAIPEEIVHECAG